MTEPVWKQKLNCTPEEAKTFLGKHILVGMAHCDPDGKVISREQFHGTIDRLNNEEGIVIRLKGSNVERTIPPDVYSLQMARPGDYTLDNTGEVVEDPDFTVRLACPGGEPVVWAKISSNGNLPDKEMLKEFLKSLFEAGIAEMESPQRRWGVPVTRLRDENDISRILGATAPVIHGLVTNEEPSIRAAIIEALFEMKAEHRIFGDKKMVSGLINPRNVPDQIATFGKNLPDPTAVKAIDPHQDDYKPIFDFTSTPAEIARRMHYCPSKPVADNSNILKSLLRIA
jgi:hypothetical protein